MYDDFSAVSYDLNSPSRECEYDGSDDDLSENEEEDGQEMVSEVEGEMSYTPNSPKKVQRRKKNPVRCPFPKKKKLQKQQDGFGLKDELPAQIVRRRPALAVKKAPSRSKPRAGDTAMTYDSTDEEGEISMTQLKSNNAEEIVQHLNDLGKKYFRAKTIQQKMQMVSRATKGELKLFGLVIKNVWEGQHGAFQLAPEEHKRLKVHKDLFREFIRQRTSFKRKKEILQEGNILVNLTKLMCQLEVD